MKGLDSADGGTCKHRDVLACLPAAVWPPRGRLMCVRGTVFRLRGPVHGCSVGNKLRARDGKRAVHLGLVRFFGPGGACPPLDPTGGDETEAPTTPSRTASPGDLTYGPGRLIAAGRSHGHRPHGISSV